MISVLLVQQFRLNITMGIVYTVWKLRMATGSKQNSFVDTDYFYLKKFLLLLNIQPSGYPTR